MGVPEACNEWIREVEDDETSASVMVTESFDLVCESCGEVVEFRYNGQCPDCSDKLQGGN